MNKDKSFRSTSNMSFHWHSTCCFFATEETVMKNTGIIFCILIFLIGAFIPVRSSISSIYGSIEPQDAAKKVLAINAKDTFVVIPQAGKFSVAVSAGTWKLYVQAVKPFKDATVENIRVVEGKSTDAGVIQLTAQ